MPLTLDEIKEKCPPLYYLICATPLIDKNIDLIGDISEERRLKLISENKHLTGFAIGIEDQPERIKYIKDLFAWNIEKLEALASAEVCDLQGRSVPIMGGEYDSHQIDMRDIAEIYDRVGYPEGFIRLAKYLTGLKPERLIGYINNKDEIYRDFGHIIHGGIEPSKVVKYFRGGAVFVPIARNNPHNNASGGNGISGSFLPRPYGSVLVPLGGKFKPSPQVRAPKEYFPPGNSYTDPKPAVTYPKEGTKPTLAAFDKRQHKNAFGPVLDELVKKATQEGGVRSLA